MHIADARGKGHGANTGLAGALVAWFEKEQRDLPWRRKYTPYGIWISEIMLQQTQAGTVVPYYERWMRRFPDVFSVARADLDEILKYWEGLGYYARAKNILLAARAIAGEYGGAFPQDLQALLRLPGIGLYTAGAILSIAFNREFPALDANAERVFSRVYDISTPVKAPANRRFIRDAAQSLIPRGRARAFNQALMELGALVCTPREPRCPACPVRDFCQARRLGHEALRPVPAQKKKTRAIQVVMGVLVHDGKILVQKRPESGLMPGLWEFPGGKMEPGETQEQALCREFAEELEIKIACGKKITVIRHAYTAFRVTLHAFWCRMDPAGQTPVPRAATELCRAGPEELEALAFPAADRKLIRLLEENNGLWYKKKI